MRGHRRFAFVLGMRRAHADAPIGFFADPATPDVMKLLERNRNLFQLEGRKVFGVEIEMSDPFDGQEEPLFRFFDDEHRKPIRDPTTVLPEQTLQFMRKLAIIGVIAQCRAADEEASRERTAEPLAQIANPGSAIAYEA